VGRPLHYVRRFYASFRYQAQSWSRSAHKWSEVGVDTRTRAAIQVSDMEVVGMGTPITLTYDSVGNP